MNEIKARFLYGFKTTSSDFLKLAEIAGIKIKKNIVAQIENRVEHISIIYDNGASRISGYGLRTSTTLAISRVIRDTYMALRNA